jgi:hypothetical protein
MEAILKISLEDIAEQLKDSDRKYTTLQEVLDEVYGMTISAANIVSVLTGNLTIPDLFKNFQPSEFLNQFIPKKYISVSREENAIYRYEKLSIANLSMLLVSFNQALKEKQDILLEICNDIQTTRKTYNIQELKLRLEGNDEDLFKTKCKLPMLHQRNNDSNVLKYINKLVQNIEVIILLASKKYHKTTDDIKETTLKYYYINLFEIASEFPEVNLWINLDFQRSILNEQLSLKEKLREIKEFQMKDSFSAFGLKDIEELLFKYSSSNIELVEEILDKKDIDNINDHHTYIENMANKQLLDDNDIDGLVLPTRKEIYIPQSYKYIYYSTREHGYKYLDNEKWSNIYHKTGENIGKELFHALRDPYNINQPIIILGHPGAGKSMLSSQFANKLTTSSEFIPLFIKLRSVNALSSDIDTHINQGIQNSIPGKPNINWVTLVKKFPNKIPVIILDGFDELLRSSSSQLYNYIVNIQKFQRQAQNLNLNLRVILTSRLTIMQDVEIPEHSLVIKLDSFDDKRKKLWLDIWNSKQSPRKHFHLPAREDIRELAKEPLLLFLLAIYDFENASLREVENQNLSQSSLYDKLFTAFARRQLNKDAEYRKLTPVDKKAMEDIFRLRIGFFALMLFLHARTYHFAKDFDEELKVFKLNTKYIDAKKILDGFFFVHKDKSVDGNRIENLSFEFLHKTFGEFLGVDFILKLSKFKAIDNEDVSHLCSDSYFKQALSYQWISSEPKMIDFLFEHSKNIITNETKLTLIKMIKKELKSMVDEKINIISPESLHHCIPFEKLKHFAIYSQNLILLWISLEENKFEFQLSKTINNVQSWKVFVSLWRYYGEIDLVGSLEKYIIVSYENNTLIIKRINKNKDYNNYSDFSHYARILDEPYETLLSYYESGFILNDLERLYNIKNEKISKSVANLTVLKIEYLYQNNASTFNADMFNALFKNISFSNKLYLTSFFLRKGLEFDVDSVLVQLKNSNDLQSLNISESFIFLDIFIQHNLVNFSNDILNFIYNKYIENAKDFSLSEQLKLAELLLKFNLIENKSPLFKDLFNNYIKLLPKHKLRLYNLYLELNNTDMYRREILASLIDEITHNKMCLNLDERLELIEILFNNSFNTIAMDILKDLFSQSKNGRVFSFSKRIKLINILFSYTTSIEIITGIIRDIYEESREGKSIFYNQRIELINIATLINMDEHYIKKMERAFSKLNVSKKVM